MRIAYTSYEFPEETGGGGIGTYLLIMSGLLKKAGHSVVIFTATKAAEPFWESEQAYRIPAKGWKELNEKLPAHFLPIHQAQPFDVLECTDFQACGLFIKKALPGLPIVVRLHTPLFLVDRLLYQPLLLLQKLRFIAGSLKNGKFPILPSSPQPKDYQNEFRMIEMAEVISSPGHSIYEKMKKLGFAVKGKTEFVPLPFALESRLKNIQTREHIRTAPEVIFIGRLELRKGVIDLANAIPKVLAQFPDARFTLIGGASNSPKAGVDMISYLKVHLKAYESSIHFTGKISRNQVFDYLDKGDIFIFPSHYESFGLVCCEAMAAGKAVIGSESGGMAEIIEHGKSGLLIPPKQPRAIVKSLIELINDNEKRVMLGRGARERINEYLSPSTLVTKQISCYQKAIDMQNLSSAQSVFRNSG